MYKRQSETLEQELTRQIEAEQEVLNGVHEEEAGKLKSNEAIHLEFASLEQKFTFVMENTSRIREAVSYTHLKGYRRRSCDHGCSGNGRRVNRTENNKREV